MPVETIFESFHLQNDLRRGFCEALERRRAHAARRPAQPNPDAAARLQSRHAEVIGGDLPTASYPAEVGRQFIDLDQNCGFGISGTWARGDGALHTRDGVAPSEELVAEVKSRFHRSQWAYVQQDPVTRELYLAPWGQSQAVLSLMAQCGPATDTEVYCHCADRTTAHQRSNDVNMTVRADGSFCTYEPPSEAITASYRGHHLSAIIGDGNEGHIDTILFLGAGGKEEAFELCAKTGYTAVQFSKKTYQVLGVHMDDYIYGKGISLVLTAFLTKTSVRRI